MIAVNGWRTKCSIGSSAAALLERRAVRAGWTLACESICTHKTAKADRLLCLKGGLLPKPVRSGVKLCRARRSLKVQARGEEIDVQDRILGALPYMIPLLDGIRYGRYFFLQFPATAQALAPIRPLVNIYYSIPFLSLIIFFALYSGVVNNFSFSRFVRYNAMQAVLLSILLVFPSLIEQILGPSGGTRLQIQMSLYNTVWLFVVTCVIYAVGSSLLGRVARLPLIASAADQRTL